MHETKAAQKEAMMRIKTPLSVYAACNELFIVPRFVRGPRFVPRPAQTLNSEAPRTNARARAQQNTYKTNQVQLNSCI
jgi:hypothetical protein